MKVAADPAIVFFEPLWNFSRATHDLIACPPQGYVAAVAPSPQQSASDYVAYRWLLTYKLGKLSGNIVPGALLRSLLQRRRKVPEGTALTYAFEHVVFRPEPYVLEVDYASLLLGAHPKLLRGFSRLLERALASPWCKRILCCTTASARTLDPGLRADRFRDKIEVVHYAVPSKKFTKTYNEPLPGMGKVKLLFVGSSTHSGSFEIKGGRELLEAFALLRSTRDNIELVFRSDLPDDLRLRCASLPDLHIWDHVVPWEQMAAAFQSADICVLPHHATAPHTILDAMSYELPVIARNSWANAEYIQAGVTGLLVRPSRRVPYYYRGTAHPNFGTAEFTAAISRPDPSFVQELAEQIALLADNPDLRRQMGRAARREVEEGRFSLETRNDKLRHIFEAAIA